MPQKAKLGQNFLVDRSARSRIVEALGEVQERTFAGQSEAVSEADRIGAELRFGRMQRPRSVVDLAAEEALSTIGRVEAISFGEPMLERAFRGLDSRAGGAIPDRELPGQKAIVAPRAFVLHAPMLVRIDLHHLSFAQHSYRLAILPEDDPKK